LSHPEKKINIKASVGNIGENDNNLINILPKTFSYKSIFCSFSLLTVWLCNFLAQEYGCKSCLLNVDEIDSINVLQAAFMHADPDSVKDS